MATPRTFMSITESAYWLASWMWENEFLSGLSSISPLRLILYRYPDLKPEISVLHRGSMRYMALPSTCCISSRSTACIRSSGLFVGGLTHLNPARLRASTSVSSLSCCFINPAGSGAHTNAQPTKLFAMNGCSFVAMNVSMPMFSEFSSASVSTRPLGSRCLNTADGVRPKSTPMMMG